ncbi:hypothetical protein SV7mr_02100 [Stieleria bergensis]|uniref:Uncharacterized protein n=1 Tax=Stieleria bergensis TaxID=2528025 RepID=A0A517SNM3_9BACT|nr:hypothetical protein SV7mr_02100 [Planctomycetes bacterium SV_7m_r]
MSQNKPNPDDQPKPKKFRITRKRLGTISFIDPKGEFGFIDAEDYRDDVFFHRSVFEDVVRDRPERSGFDRSRSRNNKFDRRSDRDQKPGRSHHRDQGSHRPADSTASQSDGTGKPVEVVVGIAKLPEAFITRHVEFEIDDDVYDQDKKLRAKIVRFTQRPMGRAMTARDSTIKVITHHPKARRKRPDWRK